MSNSSMTESCVFCGENHSYEFCPGNPVSVNYVGNHTKNSPFSPTYNPNWRNHPNFSWAGNSGLQPPGATQVQNRPPNPPGFHQGDHHMQGGHHMYQNGQSSQSHAPRQQNTSEILFPPAEVTHNPVSVQETAALPSSSTTQSPPDTAHNGQKVPTPQQKKTGPTDLDLRDLPFPGRMKAKNVDVQFKKFLDIFKQLHISIPLVEALEQMPSYVKFLKDILNKKRRLSEFDTVSLTNECSTLPTCKIPPKLKDSGSFTIPCSIGGKEVGHAWCDLGASINLMPLSIFNKLGIGEVRPTTVTLQLADRSLAYPKGKIEDILVKVNKFIFPADFLVLDYEADRNVPIILGRLFLVTGKTLIDVQKGVNHESERPAGDFQCAQNS
ncbi:uncharacterized protein LOC112523736 [Cynara cardunculus var. scolymus]|uniref:uncharacterized protein LOC112523736 n=1 Tax=Cynara cardunculus var. scolymus TaxID=59895 RepID=UPI000D62F64F|nr:uncharacterized protein LOC112523736 [Cynara cardunculus var. scolymus]